MRSMHSLSKVFVLVLLSLAGLVLSAASLAAADWPQWRGPDRNGKSSESGLLTVWPEGGPPLVYRASGLGNGYASLAVVGERVYTTGDRGEDQYLLAVKKADGTPVWKVRLGPAWDDKYIGARSTPTVDGDRVYALGTEGDLVCVKAENGEEIWRLSLVKDFGGGLMQAQGRVDWKYAESPLVDGNRVVVTPGGGDAALVALDKTTGEEIWRAKIPELGPKGADGAGYSSVVVSNGAGVKQYVQLLGRGVVGVEAATGRFLWGYNKVANNIANIATPLTFGDHVFASTGYGTGAVLLELSKTEDGVAAREVYFLEPDTFQNHHGGLIRHDGHIYTGTAHNKGFPIAVAVADGAVAWGPVRNDGRGSAAIAYADGHLYFRYQGGTMVLVEATSQAYREKGSFEIPDVEQFSWSHPVISDGRLYLREQDELLVYDVRAKDGAGSAMSE